MPGPKATNRKRQTPAPNSPPRKIAKRLAARQDAVPNSGYYQTGLKTSYFTKPGSQNRKK